MDAEKQYTRAFNNGYLLAKHEPQLSNVLCQHLKAGNNYVEGLIAGKELYELEHVKMQMAALENLRSHTKTYDRER
jgi:hypothetical protein